MSDIICQTCNTVAGPLHVNDGDCVVNLKARVMELEIDAGLLRGDKEALEIRERDLEAQIALSDRPTLLAELMQMQDERDKTLVLLTEWTDRFGQDPDKTTALQVERDEYKDAATAEARHADEMKAERDAALRDKDATKHYLTVERQRSDELLRQMNEATHSLEKEISDLETGLMLSIKRAEDAATVQLKIDHAYWKPRVEEAENRASVAEKKLAEQIAYINTFEEQLELKARIERLRAIVRIAPPSHKGTAYDFAWSQLKKGDL